MRFFPALRQSFTSTQFYWQVLHFPLRTSVAFWLKSYALLFIAAILGMIVSAFMIRNLVEQHYPNDLVFTYADGTLQSTQPLPLTLNQLGMQLALTDKETVLTDQYGEVYATPYTELFAGTSTFTVHKDDVLKFAPTVVPIFGTVLAGISLTIVMLTRIPLLLLYALVTRSVLSIIGRKIPYMVIVQMSLHIAVVAEMLNIAYFLLYRSRTFPMYDVAFFGIMILVFRSRRVQIVQID